MARGRGGATLRARAMAAADAEDGTVFNEKLAGPARFSPDNAAQPWRLSEAGMHDFSLFLNKLLKRALDIKSSHFLVNAV